MSQAKFWAEVIDIASVSAGFIVIWLVAGPFTLWQSFGILVGVTLFRVGLAVCTEIKAQADV